MTQLFTDRLYDRVEPIWASYMEHPFIKGLADGSLDEEKFKHWLKQDYIYLIEYSRLFAIGAAKAIDLEMMSTYAQLLDGTMNTEMNLHRGYAKEFGISEAELEATEPAETTTAYTSYMLNMAQIGGVENVIAAILTCTWSYNYIGLKLAEQDAAKDHPLYRKWVDMYSSEEFTQFKEDCVALMNKVTEGRSEADLKRLEDIVVRTSYYEYKFWDMAEHLSTWGCTREVESLNIQAESFKVNKVNCVKEAKGLNKQELMKLASTPVNAPTYSMVDVHFRNREFLNIVYRTDIEKLKEVVPEPLKVTSDLIKFEVIDMPDSTGLGSYTECGQVIPVEYNGEEGEFYLSMYLNNQPAIALGRELSTFPKKYGEPRLYVDNDTLVGTLDYHSLRVAQATMTYKYHPIETEEAKQLITKPSFMLKQLPNYDGTPRILEMTRSQITDIQIKEAFRGDARLQLFEHVNAPLADFPVKEIVDAQHILADLRLGKPEVIHDYLKE